MRELEFGTYRRGKVRWVRSITVEGKQRVHLFEAKASDTVSAFDVKLDTVRDKGAILTAQSQYFFEEVKKAGICKVWAFNTDDHLAQNVTLGIECEVIPLEFIIRRYLDPNGSVGKAYFNKGQREFTWGMLPDGLKPYHRFEKLWFTPTEKTEHDEPIAEEYIVARNILRKPTDLATIKKYCFEITELGERLAAEHWLVLADHKLEFGYDADGNIVLIDECLTCDSSRYYVASDTEFSLENPPVPVSKQLFRDYLVEHGYEGLPGQTPPEITPEILEELREKYVLLLKMFTGIDFVSRPVDDDESKRLIKKYLSEQLIV